MAAANAATAAAANAATAAAAGAVAAADAAVAVELLLKITSSFYSEQFFDCLVLSWRSAETEKIQPFSLFFWAIPGIWYMIRTVGPLAHLCAADQWVND